MTDKITFRLDDDLAREIVKVYKSLTSDGLDLDQSKVLRYILNKGIEKLKLEGKIK